MDDDAGGLLRLRVGVCRLDSDGHAVLGEDPVDPGVRQQFRSGVGSVLKIGAHRALFGAGLIAHPAVPDQVGVVFLRVDVERGDPIRVPELGRTVPQPLMRAILGGDLVVAFDPVEHRLQVFIERRGVDVRQAQSSAQQARTVSGVSNEFDQLTVLPPPTVLPAAMLTMPSAEGKNPPRRNSF